MPGYYLTCAPQTRGREAPQGAGEGGTLINTKAVRDAVSRHYGLHMESVSMINARPSADYPDAPQVAVVLPDARFPENERMRARDEDRLLDLLTTPGTIFVEVDRTPTRVFLAVVAK